MPFIDRSPLNYPANQFDPIRRYTDNRPPAITDFKQFKVGDEWLDTAGSLWYKMVYRDQTQGIWQVMTAVPFTTENLVGNDTLVVGPDIFGNINVVGDGISVTTTGNPGTNTLTISLVGGGLAIDSITPDSGGQTAPDATGNINYLGDTAGYLNGVHFFGTPGTNTISARDLRNITKYVVDATALETEYTTIQAALDAANLAGIPATVYIRPGTYTENLTLYNGINLAGENNNTIIIGIHTPPAAGSIQFFSITFQSDTDILNSVVAGTTAIEFFDCIATCINGYVFNLVNWTGNLSADICNFNGTDNGVINNAAGANVFISSASIGDGTVNQMQVNGATTFENVNVRCPINMTGQSIGLFTMGCKFDQTITTADLTIFDMNDSIISTGATAAIVHNSTGLVKLNHVTIDSTNVPAIDGNGTIELGSVVFINNANLNGAMTLQAAQYQRGGPQNVLSADATDATEDSWTKYEIQGVSGYSWGIDNSDTDNMKLTDGIDPSNGTEILKFDSANAYAMTLNNAYTFPTTDGALNDVLTTNGAGVVTWQPSGVGAAVQTLTGDAGGAVGIDAFNNINLLGGNNITVTGNPGANTLSFAVTGTTDHRVQIGNATGSLTSLAAMGNGDIIIGSAGADPVIGALASAGGTIVITPGAGTINLETSAEVAIVYTAEDATFAIPALQNLNIVGTATNGINTTAAGSTITIGMASPYSDGDFTFTTATAGATRVLTVSNTDNTGANYSAANMQITVGGTTTTGDPFTNFLVTGGGTFSLGIDNSDSDQLKITTGANPSSGSTLMRIAGSGNVYTELGDFYVQRAQVGGIVENISSNTDNSNAASSAGLFAMVGGASAGDPYTNYLVNGAGTYSVGIDNSDSDKFKITASTTPSAGSDLFTMTSAGVITLANDLDVSEGGTGVSTLTSHGILMGNGAGDIQATAEPTDGQLLIGKTGDFPQLATISAGVGVAITNAAGSITISAAGGGMTWSAPTVNANIVVNNGYIANKAGLLTMTLPATAVLGDTIRLTGMNTAVGWRIAQNANQVIHFGTTSTTVGVGGYLEATQIRDSVELVCVVAGASTEWNVLSSIGNITVV